MNLHQPIHFDDQTFSDIPLANEPEHRVRHALAALLENRAFFLTGAGASAAAPTGLPTGPQLARKLVEWARHAGYGAAIDGVADESDLGSVCEAVEADAGPTTLRPWLVGAADWEGAPVNLGHFAVALLFAEGVVQISFTANWDTLQGTSDDQATTPAPPPNLAGQLANDRVCKGQAPAPQPCP